MTSDIGYYQHMPISLRYVYEVHYLNKIRNHMKYIMIGMVLSIGILSCSKEQPEIHEENLQTEAPVTAAGLVSLDELEIGDEWNYLLFKGENYYDQANGNYTFTGDTLNVEVCGLKDGKYVVSEKITEGSTMFHEENDYYYYYPDSVFTNFWQVRNDSLIITQKDDPFFSSHILLGQTNSLNLLEFQDNLVEMNGWKTTYPYIESYVEAHVIDGEISGITYPFLNVLINNIAMAVDGDGLTYIYNRDDGIVSSSRYSWWTSTGVGWELIVD